MICIVPSQSDLFELSPKMVKDAYCVYLSLGDSLMDAIEPIMYKFLERVAEGLENEIL